jgi:RNA polymerase sigma-70 factor, ECF subfamily
MTDEETLIAQAQQDSAHFRELYPRYVKRIYGYIAYRVGRKQDTEDLVSETFVRALERLNDFKYRGEGSFAAWLFQIAYYVVGEFYREQTKPVSITETPELTPFEDDLIQKEKFALVQYQLQFLPPRQREVIILKYLGGLRNQEIAEVLQVNEKSISAYLSRGIDTLQAILIAEEVKS